MGAPDDEPGTVPARHNQDFAPACLVRATLGTPGDVPSILDDCCVSTLGDDMITRCKPSNLRPRHEGAIAFDCCRKTLQTRPPIGRDHNNVWRQKGRKIINRRSMQHRSMASTRRISASALRRACSPCTRNQRLNPRCDVRSNRHCCSPLARQRSVPMNISDHRA